MRRLLPRRIILTFLLSFSCEASEDLEGPKEYHIKSAFKLMGLEYLENKKVLKGHVDYKMKHIRLQNRHLKLHQYNKNSEKSTVPKHIRFDEDGNIIAENKDIDEVKRFCFFYCFLIFL